MTHGFCFTSTTVNGLTTNRTWKENNIPLAGDNDSLTNPCLSHGSIGILCNGKEMRFQLSPFPATIRLNYLGAVECDTLERVNGYENNTTVGVYAVLCIAVSNRMEY